MRKIKETLLRIAHLPYTKYIVVLVIGVLFIGFLDENSVWNHFRYKQRVVELKEEIAVYEKNFERDQKTIHELQHNPKAMERIARERYFMKAADEDIFVLSDDEVKQEEKTLDDERTE
ncbi:MAG: septum formation initiator family protein [Prevotella sp.]|nr:septum formation initiator family protein [Prevotella sp.]